MSSSRRFRQISWCMLVTVFILSFVIFSSRSVLAGSKEKPIIWKATSVYGSGLIVFEGAKLLADRVKEMSNGRLIIQMNTGGSIVPRFSEQEAVSKGAIDLCCTSSIYIKGKFPTGVLFGASIFAFKQQEFIAWLETGGGYELWQEMYDRKGYNVKVLPCNGLYATESLGWYNKPINSLEDFKGLKYRTTGEWGEVMKKLGASVVTLPASELYTALERGVLDAADMSFPAVDRGLGLYEVCKYMIFPGVHQTSGPLETLVNKDKWNKLPDDLKAIVKSALSEVAVLSLTRWFKADAEAIEFFKEKGVKILRIKPEIIAQIEVLFKEVLDSKAAKDPFYAKVLKSQREFHKLWGDYAKLQTW